MLKKIFFRKTTHQRKKAQKIKSVSTTNASKETGLQDKAD
jgi:hypothetical protein